jgi:hypothetical protein
MLPASPTTRRGSWGGSFRPLAAISWFPGAFMAGIDAGHGMELEKAAKIVGRKEIPMRALVPPPPSLVCELCGGELQFKRIANRVNGLDNEIFVCVNCGHCGCFTNPKHRYYDGCRREACLHRAFVFAARRTPTRLA